MLFKQIKLGKMENFSYVIGDENTRECMIVDPGWEIEKLLDAVEDYKVIGILVTHNHYDHIQELDKAVELTKAKVYVHFSDTEIRDDINKKLLKDGDVILIGKLKLKVIHTPGHNPTCVCFLVQNKLISGDTIFVEGCGRCDLPGSDVNKQWDSLCKIKSLDETTEVYPGHDYGSRLWSTIKYEKANNPYLKFVSKEEFVNDRVG